MGFVAGWVESNINNQIAEELSKKMIDYAPEQSKYKIKTLSTSQFICSAEKKDTVTFDQCSFVGYGGYLSGQNKLEEIVKIYKEKGENFISELKGDFTLVLEDHLNKKLILAIDPLGLRNLYYAETPKGLVFASTADSVICHPEVGTELSSQSIYDYVYFHHCPSPNTIYRRVKKLEGGQMLVYQGGKVTLKRYWMPTFSEKMEGSIDESVNELKQKLSQAVMQLSNTEDNTGAFLSGGLDSSSVAGALSHVFPEQAKTFTIGFHVAGYDEIEYARIAVKRFKTKQHEYYLTEEDTVAAIPKIAAYYDEPFGNSSALAAYYCAKMAKENGIHVLLAGDGGDELFAGNERYARQLLFESYYKIPGVLRSSLKKIIFNSPEFLVKNNIFSKGKRFIEQAETPLPDRLQDYNFLHRHAAEEVFSDGFLQVISLSQPLELLRDSYNRPDQASSLNRMLYMDWKTTLHDNDLVKVNKMCEMADIDVRYPLLDQEIIELSCKIPSIIKLKGQKLRWFYKQAMNDFLPDEIINKPKHGFGLPFGVWLKDYEPLKALAYDSITDLKKRPYFRAEFLDHAIKMHQSIHAAYYGELIWILMMLELWLQAKKH